MSRCNLGELAVGLHRGCRTAQKEGIEEIGTATEFEHGTYVRTLFVEFQLHELSIPAAIICLPIPYVLAKLTL